MQAIFRAKKKNPTEQWDSSSTLQLLAKKMRSRLDQLDF